MPTFSEQQAAPADLATREVRANRLAGALRRGMVSILALLVAYLAIVAVRLRVDYFDAYENLVNASRIVHGGGTYSIARALFYPLLLTPLALAARITHSPQIEFVGAHLLAVLLFGLLLMVSYLLFRFDLGQFPALTGVTLLAVNPLLIGNAPLAKEDIPGALGLSAGFYFYLRGRQQGQLLAFVAAGTCIAAAIGSRYNLLPVPFLVIAAYESVDLVVRIRSHRWDRSASLTLLAKAVPLGLLPIALFLLMPVIVYPAVAHSSALQAPARFVSDIRILIQANALHEDPLETYRFLAKSVTWPVLLVVAVGVISSLRSRRRGSLFFAIWLTFGFLIQTYAISHNEARYLLPILPPLYFFVAVGLMAIGQAITGLVHARSAAELAAAVTVAAILVLPATGLVRAVVRFQDPVYTQDYERGLGRYAASLVRDGHLFWIGPYYPLHPRDYVFDRADAFTYVYHFYSHIAGFWSRLPSYPIGTLAGQSSGNDAARIAGPDLESQVRDGDVLIVNPASAGYATADMPRRLPPLIVERINILTFAPAQGSAGAQLSNAATGAQIELLSQSASTSLTGRNIPDGHYDLYIVSGGTGQNLGPITVAEGGFQADTATASTIDRVLLLSYSAVRTFSPPTD